MTNSKSKAMQMKFPQLPDKCQLFAFKGSDSYCYSPYNSSIGGGRSHV